MRSLSRILSLLAVSCDAAAPTARTPVQVVEIVRPSDHGIVENTAHAAERTAPAPSAARFAAPCRSFAPEPESAETAATVNLPFGALSVHVVHRSHSADDICLATLTDAQGAVTDCKTFADEGCDVEVPVASAERVTVDGVCITERCDAAPQRARRIFEVAASASGIEVRATTGEVVVDCVEE